MAHQKSFLISIYTKSPLHVGAGTSVDIVDLPINRERITNYPVIPGSAVKGVLRQTARDFGMEDNAQNILFGNENGGRKDAEGSESKAYAGAMSFGEAKLLAWPVRSLKGCFAWITCPLALKRFARDTGAKFTVPDVKTDHCFAPNEVTSGSVVVLEEYPLTVASSEEYEGVKSGIETIVRILVGVNNDPVWSTELAKRLVIVSDENFQHFVTTTTEIMARIQMDPKTRTNKNLFNQENVPCETLLYSICTYLGERTKADEMEKACTTFDKLFGEDSTFLQFGGDETIGLGLCDVKKSLIGGE